MNQQGEYGLDNRGSGEATGGAQAWARTERERDAASGSVPTLLRQLTSEITGLFHKEVSLARAEMRETVHEVKGGIVALMSGGIVLLAGVIVLLMAAVYGLAEFMDIWLAALIVGGVVCLIGMSMVATGKNKLGGESLKPHRTAHSLKEDRNVMMHAVKGGR